MSDLLSLLNAPSSDSFPPSDLANNHSLKKHTPSALYPWNSKFTFCPISGSSAEQSLPSGDQTSNRVAVNENGNENEKATAQENKFIEYRASPLILACLAGNFNAVKFLIEKGCDPLAEDSLGRNAIVACIYGFDTLVITSQNLEIISQTHPSHLNILRYILSHISSKSSSGNKQINQPQNCVHGITLLCLASYLGKELVVEELLKHGADVDAVDSHSATPLMYAARDGHIAVVRMLLKHGASPVKRDRNLWSALDYGQLFPDVATELRKFVARLSVPASSTPASNESSPNEHGTTTPPQNHHNLLSAIKTHNVQLLSALLQLYTPASLNIPDSATSLTPLMVAIRMPLPHISTITLLLAHGADPNIPSSTGRISLHHLAKIPGRDDKHLSLIAQRLISYGCKLDTVDKAGNTAIMYAAERGYSKLITTLYEMGARLDVKNRKGKSIKDMVSPDNAELKRLIQKYLPPSQTQGKEAAAKPSVDVPDQFNTPNAPSQPSLEDPGNETVFSSQKRDSYSNTSTPRENRAAPFEVINDTSPLFQEMDHSPSTVFSSTPTPPTSSPPSSDRSTPSQAKPDIHPRQKSVSSIKSENLEHLEAVLNRLDAELSASENRTSQVAPSEHFDPPPPVERTDTAVQYSPPNPPVDIETPRISSGELTPPEWENRYTELVQQVNSLLESDPSFSTLSSEHRLSGTTVTDSPMKESMPDLSLPRSRPVSTSSFKRSPLKQNPMNKIDSGVSFSEPPHPEFDDEERNETIDEDLDSLQMRYEILTENLAEIKNDIDEVQSALEKVKTDKIKIRQVERKLTARVSELKSNLLSSSPSTLRQRDFATQTELNTIRNQLTEIKKRNTQADQFVQSYSNEFHRLCLDRIRLEKERKKVMKALKVVKRRGLFVETIPNLPRSRTTSVEEMEEIFVEELKREMEGDKELIESLRNELESAKHEIDELKAGVGKIEKDRDASKTAVDMVNRHRREEVRRMMSVICTLSSLFPENALFDQLGAKTKEAYDTITSSDLPETARSEHIKTILDDVCECYTHLEAETNKVFLRNEELEKQNERLTKKSNDLELSVELLEGRIVALTANQNRLQDEIKRGSELLNMVSNAAARSPTKKKEHMVPIDTKLSGEPAFGFDDFERTLEEQERSTLPTPPPSTAETSPVNLFKIDPKQKRRSTPPQSPSISKPRRTQTSGTQTSPPQLAKKKEKPTIPSRPVKSQSTRPLVRSDSSSSDSFPQSNHSRTTTSTSASSRQDFPEFEDMSPVMETYVRALESATAAYQHLAASSPSASPKRRKAKTDKPDVDWLEQFEMEWERRRDRLEKSDTFSTTSESSTSNSGNGSSNGNGDTESPHGDYERRGPTRPTRYDSDEPEEDESEDVSDSDDEEDVLLSNIKRNGRSIHHSKSKSKSSPGRSSSTGRVPVSSAPSSSRSIDKHQRRQQPTSCLKKSSKYEASFEPPPPPPKNENFFAQAMNFNNGLPSSHSILKVSGKTVLPGMYQQFQERSDRTESSSSGRKKKQHAIVEEEVDYGSSLRKVKSYANIRDRDVTSSSTSTTQNYRREPTPNSPKITSVRSRSRSISSSVSSGSHKQSQSSRQPDEVDYESRGRTRDSERESITNGHINGVSESRKKRSLSAFSIGRNRSKSRARSEYVDDEVEGDGSAKSKILKSIRKMNSTLGFWKHSKHDEHPATTQYRSSSTTLQAF